MSFHGLVLVNVTFEGSRKSTAYAAQVVTQDAGKVAMSHGMKEVLVKVKVLEWEEILQSGHYKV